MAVTKTNTNDDYSRPEMLIIRDVIESVVHALANPLAVIQANTEYLTELIEDSPISKHKDINSLLSEQQHSIDKIKSVLSNLRVFSGQSIGMAEPFRLDKSVNEAISIASFASYSNFDVSTSLDKEVIVSTSSFWVTQSMSLLLHCIGTELCQYSGLHVNISTYPQPETSRGTIRIKLSPFEKVATELPLFSLLRIICEIDNGEFSYRTSKNNLYFYFKYPLVM